MFRTHPELAWSIVFILALGHLIFHGLIHKKSLKPVEWAGMAVAGFMLIASGAALIQIHWA